jgi:hypothetical protein
MLFTAGSVLAAGQTTNKKNTKTESDFTVVAGIDIAFKQLNLNVGADGSGMSTPFTTVNPNLVLAYKRVYASLAYDSTINSTGNLTLEQGAPQVMQLSRNDLLLTFGVRLTRTISLFTGWLDGVDNVLIQGSRRDWDPGLGVYVYNYFVQEIKYSESGPFGGFSLSFPAGNKGTLGLSVAYASMNGQIEEYRNITNMGDRYEKNDVDVTGLSYGLTWTGPLTGSLAYRAGVKATRYTGEQAGGNSQDIIERYTSFFLGISNYFQ